MEGFDEVICIHSMEIINGPESHIDRWTISRWSAFRPYPIPSHSTSRDINCPRQLLGRTNPRRLSTLSRHHRKESWRGWGCRNERVFGHPGQLVWATDGLDVRNVPSRIDIVLEIAGDVRLPHPPNVHVLRPHFMSDSVEYTGTAMVEPSLTVVKIWNSFAWCVVRDE